MSRSKLELKVGLFVFIGLALLGILLLQFSKGTSLFRPTITILLRASNVGGLKPRADVLMSGVKVGAVSDILLAPDGKSVTIKLKIYREYVIHKDARFTIEQAGFLGDQYVAILPTLNEGPAFINGDEAKAEAPFNLQEVARSASGFIQRIDETARRLNDMIAQVHTQFVNDTTLSNLSVAVANVRQFSAEASSTVNGLRALMNSNAPAIAQSSSNLLTFSSQLDSFGNSLNELLNTNRPRIDLVVSNIEASSGSLKGFLGEVEAGKGLAGTLVKNEQVANDVAEITRNLSITTSNLNRLGVWGVLWKHKPPPAKPERPPPILRSPKERE